MEEGEGRERGRFGQTNLYQLEDKPTAFQVQNLQHMVALTHNQKL
jgi:hypothetical protein